MEQNQSMAALNLLSNTTPVTVVANDTIEGNPIVTPIVNKENGMPKTDLQGNPLGSIRLEQLVSSLNNGSFFNTRRRVAFIGGTMEQLEALVARNGIKAGFTLAGKIAIKETLEPQYKGHEPKINPSSGEVVQIMVGKIGYPIYQRQTYTDDASVKDELIKDQFDVIKRLNEKEVAGATNVLSNPVVHAGVPQA